MKTGRLIYRQGDVGIIAANLPKDAVRKEVNGPIILAYGEVTGHCHQIRDTQNVELYEKDGVVYVHVLGKSASLTHEEHGTIELPKGTHEIRIQREYQPEGIRNVLD